MERAHGELRSRLANGLRRDNADCLAQLDGKACAEMATVAEHTATDLRFAGEHRANLDALDIRRFDGLSLNLVNFLIRLSQLCFRTGRIHNVLGGMTAHETFGQLYNNFLAFADLRYPDAIRRAAIHHSDDHVLRHVDEFACHVAGVGGLERGVGESLAGAVRGHEVFDDRKALAEVRQNWLLDDFTGRFGHEAADTGELPDLRLVASRAGVHHQIHRVELLLALVLLQGLEHDVRDLVGAMRPNVDDLVVALATGNCASAVLLVHLANLLQRALNFLLLGVRDDHVINTDRNARFRRLTEAQFLEQIQRLDGLVVAGGLVTIPDEVTDLALVDNDVSEAHRLRPNLRENHSSHGGLDDLLVRDTIDRLFAEIRVGEQNAIVRLQVTFAIGEHDFVLRAEEH